MRKFWKKQVEDLGGDPSVLLKGRTQLAKEMVIAFWSRLTKQRSPCGMPVTLLAGPHLSSRTPAWSSGRASKTALTTKGGDL
jgi:hypothetical protein